MEQKPDGQQDQAFGGEGRYRLEEGETIVISVSRSKGKVVMTFPRPVSWIQMPKSMAHEVARLLSTYASE